jgi:glycosyltransferase involved in cell wall biosynthesis
MTTKYVIITPVRDEEAYLRGTIESIVQQTVAPAEWVIVNDGSKDATGDIIDEAARQYPWIHACHRSNRGFRKSGGGVVEAFNDGYAALQTRDFDFIVKLDGDLTFLPTYFENCFQHFENDPRLGVGGGMICHMIDGVPQVEAAPAFHVRGATKIYRRACWNAIGGFWVAPGWDTLDEVKANMCGWTSRSFPELRLTHHRITSSADGAWGGPVKNGKADYICGYHPLFALLKYSLRCVHGPREGMGLLYGYLMGYLKRIPQVDDPELIRYLRRQQFRKMTGRETIWK